MTDKQTPPEWVIREAEKRAGINLPIPTMTYLNGGAFAALCDMIERHEQPPIDRKLLCAREAVARRWKQAWPEELEFRHGYRDDRDPIVVALRAIDLWEEGFGK
jgi:hypothetical protein